MILVISGTNRKGSNSLKVAQHLEGYIQGHPDRQEAQVIDLATLPSSLMDPEIYAKKPPEFEPGTSCPQQRWNHGGRSGIQR